MNYKIKEKIEKAVETINGVENELSLKIENDLWYFDALLEKLGEIETHIDESDCPDCGFRPHKILKKIEQIHEHFKAWSEC